MAKYSVCDYDGALDDLNEALRISPDSQKQCILHNIKIVNQTMSGNITLDKDMPMITTTQFNEQYGDDNKDDDCFDDDKSA